MSKNKEMSGNTSLNSGEDKEESFFVSLSQVGKFMSEGQLGVLGQPLLDYYSPVSGGTASNVSLLLLLALGGA